MDTLKELVKVVNRKRLSKIDLFDKTFLNQSNSNLYFKLYDGLDSGIIKDDESAANYLYGSQVKDARFRKIKSRFKDKIKNTLLLLDANDVFQNNSQTRAYYNSLRNLHIIEILVKLNGTNSVVYELIKDDVKSAESYKFFDILKTYSYHKLNYFSLTGDVKSYAIEEKKYLDYVEYANKDQQSKYLFWKILMNFTSKNNITNESLVEIGNQIKSYKDLVFFLNQKEAIYLYYYLLLLYNENNGNAELIVEICDILEKFLKDNPEINSNMRNYLILYYRLKANLHLKQFSNGLKLFHTNKSIIPIESNNNWFALKEFEFKLYLQDHKISQSYDVYRQVNENKSFRSQAELTIEKWKIYHAYLVFLDNYLNKGDFKFSLTKFLNEVPFNSKDKSGFNFAIRVVEMLFQFARKDYSFLFQKMDALRVYRSRYLTDNTYKRNHLFLSLLLKAEKSGFMAKDMEKADWEEIRELRQQNTHIIADWEIIPYEELWDIFVDLAKK